MIVILHMLTLLLLTAQEPTELGPFINNNIFALSNNALGRAVGLAFSDTPLPEDIHIGQLEDYRPSSIDIRDIIKLTIDFFDAFTEDGFVLGDIMNTYVSESEDGRVSWTIENSVAELQQLTYVRIGVIQSIGNKAYSAAVRLRGVTGSTTVTIIYERVTTGWRIIDLEGDLLLLQEVYSQMPFNPASIQAPFPGS